MIGRLISLILVSLLGALFVPGCIFAAQKEGPFIPGPDKVRELVREVWGIGALSISADGSKMLYVASVDPTNERVFLAIRDAKYGRALQLYENTPITSAVWGPGSDSFAYLEQVAGGGRKSIGVLTDEALATENIVDFFGYDAVSTPAWSPDGRFIAFWSRKASNGNADESTLWMVRPDGSDLKTLYGGPGSTTIGTLDGNIIWSPDTSKLLFTMSKGAAINAFVLERRGGGPKNLTPNYLKVSDLFWSPDGKRIGFAADDRAQTDGPPRMGIMNADGSGKTILAPYGTPVGWIPNSGELAYLSLDQGAKVFDTSPRLEAVDVRTKAVRLLAEVEDATIVAAATSRDSRVFFVTADAYGVGQIMVVE